MKIVPVMRAGLSLTEEALRCFCTSWDDVFPVEVHDGRVSGSVPPDDHYVIVESNVATGRTLRAVIDHLSQRYPDATITTFGTARTTVGQHLLDFCLNGGRHLIDRYLIAVVGLPGSGKSLLSHILAGFGYPRYKWADYLPSDPGRYGEALTELESNDPYALPRHFVATSGIREKDARVVVLDGPKDWRQIEFVSFATRRPVFVVWVEWSTEEIRRRSVRLRGDRDDRCDEDRLRFFAARLDDLRRRAAFHVSLDSDLADLFRLYDILGWTPAGRTVPQPWASKAQVLDWALHEVRRGRVTLPVWKEVQTSGSYARKLSKMGLNNRDLLEHVETIRRGFKVIDDVLDEDETRDGSPSLWREIGLIPAVITGIAYLQRAAVQASRHGLQSAYLRMIEDVADAVRAEIDVEERRETSTPELWLRVARREAAFREYLAMLAGQPPGSGYLDGLRAQALDDLLGHDKEGRNGHERTLGRPLFGDIFGGVDPQRLQRLKGLSPGTRDEAEKMFLEVVDG